MIIQHWASNYKVLWPNMASLGHKGLPCTWWIFVLIHKICFSPQYVFCLYHYSTPLAGGWNRDRLSIVVNTMAGDNLVKNGYRRQWALTRYTQLQIAHAPGMPGTFSPPPQVSDPDMHHGTCVTHVPWCMPGSLTSSFLWSRWRGKHSARNVVYLVRGPW